MRRRANAWGPRGRCTPARPAAGLAIALGLAASACSRPAIAPPPASPRAVIAEAFTKPLGFSVQEDYAVGDDLAGIANDFRLMHELGIDTWRGALAWSVLEPGRDARDFAWLHAFAELAALEHIRLRPYVALTPAWAAAGRSGDGAAWNDPPAEPSRWTSFVLALATELQHHPNVLSYEIYNEPDTRTWWDGSVAEYAATLAGASAAIRTVHPGAQVLLGGLAFPDAGWIRRLCGELGAGPTFDVLPLHAFPEARGTDTTTVERWLGAAYHDAFVPAVDSLCGPKPIWVNELGAATTGDRTEWDQAWWWARAIATFAASRRVEHLGIFELRDALAVDPSAGLDPAYHLGLVYADGTRKVAFSTIQLLVALLNTGTITVADPDVEIAITARREGELHHHLFVRPDGRQVLVLWDRSRSPIVEVRFRRGGSSAVAYDVDGSGAAYPWFSEGTLRRVALRAGEVRVFVIDP